MSLPSPLVHPPLMGIVPAREPEPKRDVPATTFIGAVEPLPATTARERTFAEVFERLFAPMHHTCNRLLADPDLAKDVVQRTMLHLEKKWDNIPPEDRTDAYFMAAARNRALDALKARRRRERWKEKYAAELEDTVQLPVFDVSDRQEVIDASWRIIAAMPARRREVFVLSYDPGYGYSVQETADALGISLETVKTHRNRGLRELRNRLRARPELLAEAGLLLLASGEEENDHE